MASPRRHLTSHCCSRRRSSGYATLVNGLTAQQNDETLDGGKSEPGGSYLRSSASDPTPQNCLKISRSKGVGSEGSECRLRRLREGSSLRQHTRPSSQVPEESQVARRRLTSVCYCRGKRRGSTALALQLALWVGTLVAQQKHEPLGRTASLTSKSDGTDEIAAVE